MMTLPILCPSNGRVVWPSAWLGAFLVVLLGATSGRAAEADTSGLDRLNAYRTASGLPPVELDPQLTKGCQAHADYLAKNVARLGKPGFRTDDESDTLPGYSEEGKKIAQAAFTAFHPQDTAAVVDEWMAMLFFRLLLLDPNLKRVGWASAKTDRGWFGVLDAFRGRGSNRVVFYPVEDQKDVPLAYSGTEMPDPIPQATHKRAGYPVTVTFPRETPVRNVTARMSDDTNEEVASWLSTPEKPVKDAAQFQNNSICLMAKEPLRPNTTYTVAVIAQVGGAEWKQKWTFTTGDGKRQKPDEKTAEARINVFRKIAGLSPVALDPVLSKGCQAHADYLVTNSGHPSLEGLGSHDEDPKLPGFTEEGRRAGKSSDIFFGLPPLDSVDGWMATFFHRVPLLDPDLTRVGFGSAKDKRDGWITVLDVLNGRGWSAPVHCPGDQQKDVPLAYQAGERPDPIPESKTKKAGYPVTVTFPRSSVVKNATAKLMDEKNQEIACWLSTPEKSVDAGLQRNTVCLIAKEPLQPNTTYTATASATVDGVAWTKSWTFTTGGK
jgi:uncharacterized protein YkwD